MFTKTLNVNYLINHMNLKPLDFIFILIDDLSIFIHLYLCYLQDINFYFTEVAIIEIL